MSNLFLKLLQKATIRAINKVNVKQGVAYNVNTMLDNEGLPPIKPGSPYLKHYRLAPPPRFTFGWRGLRITEVYITFMCNDREDPALFDQLMVKYGSLSQYLRQSKGDRDWDYQWEIDYVVTFK